MRKKKPFIPMAETSVYDLLQEDSLLEEWMEEIEYGIWHDIMPDTCEILEEKYLCG